MYLKAKRRVSLLKTPTLYDGKSTQRDLETHVRKRRMEKIVFCTSCAFLIYTLRRRKEYLYLKDRSIPIKTSSKRNTTFIPIEVPLNSTLTDVKKFLVFKKYFGTQYKIRGNLRLVNKVLLTPLSLDKRVYHFAFSFIGEWLNYKPGDSLAIEARNDKAVVIKLLEILKIDGTSIVTNYDGSISTIRSSLINDLDLFGSPSRKFYAALSKFTKSTYETLKLLHLSTDDLPEYKVGKREGIGYIDLLREYKSISLSAKDLLQLLPRNKPRLYSISSAAIASPSEIHLLVSVVTWNTPTGKLRFGQCSTYLASLREGDVIQGSIKGAMMNLPTDLLKPIVMVGLGTGVAPFRSFVLDRMTRKDMGEKIGTIALYFGARYRNEYLYGTDFDRIHNRGIITRLGLAFSREQEGKVYVQHKIEEDQHFIKRLLDEEEGSFYLCGPIWPVPDVKKALDISLSPQYSVDELKESGRFLLEVY